MRATLIQTCLLLGMSLGTSSEAGEWSGTYKSSFSFQMTRASLCPKPLSLSVELRVQNSRLSGRIRNLGSENENEFCSLYHDGNIRGSIDAAGNLEGVKITQRDAHSAQYASYAITGNIKDTLRLISRSAKFHPTKAFRLTRVASIQSQRESADSSSASKTAAAAASNFSKARAIFIELSPDERRRVQTVLKEANFYKSAIDGLWGKKTFAALNEYMRQQDNGQKTLATALEELSAGGELTAPPEQSSTADITTTASPDSGSSVEAAQDFIGDVESYIESGAGHFDITFAEKYAAVSPVKNGEWAEDAQQKFAIFKNFVLSDEKFAKYREHRVSDREEVAKERTQQASRLLTEKISTLRSWVKKNLLDERAPEIVKQIERFESVREDVSFETLEAMLVEAQKIIASLGADTTTVQGVKQETDQQSQKVRESSSPLPNAPEVKLTSFGSTREVGDGFRNYEARQGYRLLLFQVVMTSKPDDREVQASELRLQTTTDKIYRANESASTAFAAQRSGMSVFSESSIKLETPYLVVFEVPEIDATTKAVSFVSQ